MTFLAHRSSLFAARKGIAVIELVVAVAIISVAFVGVFSVGRFSLATQRAETLGRRASFVGAEGMAAARFVRDADWSGFAALPNDTNLYPHFSGGDVTLTQSNPGPIDGVFTQIVRLSAVYRDGNGNIAPSGTLDTNTRFVAITVSWTGVFGGTRSLTMNSYLTKIAGF